MTAEASVLHWHMDFLYNKYFTDFLCFLPLLNKPLIEVDSYENKFNFFLKRAPIKSREERVVAQRKETR